MRFAVGIMVCALVVVRSSVAQEYVPAATAELASGLQGGGGSPSLGLSRTRTMLRLGADVYVDESPRHLLSAAALIEVEPRAGLGLDARYAYLFKNRVAFGAGPSAILAPNTLYGGGVDATLRVPLADKLSLTAGPAFLGYFLGTDLPDRTVLWQCLLRVGLRASL